MELNPMQPQTAALEPTHVTAPLKPTDAMLRAGAVALRQMRELGLETNPGLYGIYRAMLDASQEKD